MNMSEICPHCHIGAAIPQRGTWARSVGSHLIVVPGIKTHVCDACGWLEYDQDALGQLGALLQLGGPLNTVEKQLSVTTISLDRRTKDWVVPGA